MRLEEEIALLDHYLAIQAIRFGDRLRIELDIAPDIRRALVPSLVMQPLVENAIRHGLAPRAAGGTTHVTARRAGNRLEIRICDDGVGLPAGWSLDTCAGQGVGPVGDAGTGGWLRSGGNRPAAGGAAARRRHRGRAVAAVPTGHA